MFLYWTLLTLLSVPTALAELQLLKDLRCPWTKIQYKDRCGMCVRRYHERFKWLKAREHCKAEGADLVEIPNKDVDDALKALAARPGYTTQVFWTGMQDLDRDGRDRWLEQDEEPVYNRMDPGHSDGEQVCGAIHVGKSSWDREMCSHQHGFICEKSTFKSLVAIDSPPKVCPTGWIESKSSRSCVKLYKIRKPWHEAYDVCRAEGADMVRIVDKEMNSMINGNFSDSKFWIGIWKPEKKRVYQWLDGSHQQNYTYWSEEQASTLTEERCGYMERTLFNEGTWNSRLCSDKLDAVLCEKSPVDRIPFRAKNTVCLTSWTKNPSSGTCVKAFNQKMTWYHARGECKEFKGGDLVNIVDFSMNEFIHEHLLSKDKTPYWFGLIERRSRSKYEWLNDPSKTHFHFWSDEVQLMRLEPNNCGQINKDSKGAWSDADCRDRARYLCERPPVSIDITRTKNRECTKGWVWSKYSKTCFKIYHEKKNWKNARHTCQSQGTDLVKIMDSTMNRFIATKIHCDPDSQYWIGLNDLKNEGSFSWLDELHKPNYMDWAVPGSNNTENRDCVEINYKDLTREGWTAANCADTNKFICEKLPGPIPCLDEQSGWFGEGCRYKCNCKDPNEDCNRFDGTCTECADNMFGPGCQYRQAASNIPTTNITRQADGRCKPMYGYSVTIILDPPTPLTFIRLIGAAFDKKIEMKYRNRRWKTWGRFYCQNTMADNETRDYACDMDAVDGVHFFGPGVKQLCRILISRGRNVALRQPTIQKSTLHSWHPEKAVDGDVDIPNDTLSQRQTCTHTEPGDKGWWQVSFAKPVYIYQISLHNRRNPDRAECCEERLQGFNLTAYPMDGTLTPYTYKEPGLGKPQDVYHVLPDDSYLKVPIQAVRVEAADGILTLCEVVIYGDTACRLDYFGWNCEYKCNCAGSTTKKACLPNGLCHISGCYIGYTGEDCYTPTTHSHLPLKASGVLTNVKEIIGGRSYKPVVLDCNVYVAGLQCKTTYVENLIISRILLSSGEKEDIIHINQNYGMSFHHNNRNWGWTRVRGVVICPDTIMKLQLIIHDPKCTDAGTYFCQVEYRQSEYDYLRRRTVHQVLPARAGLLNLQMSVTRAKDPTGKLNSVMAIMCSLEGPQNYVTLNWGQEGEFAKDKSIDTVQPPITSVNECPLWRHKSSLFITEDFDIDKPHLLWCSATYKDEVEYKKSIKITTKPIEVSCPKGRYGRSCLQISNDFKDWISARMVCQAKGGDLLKIDNNSEKEFVENAIGSIFTFMWIGLHQRDKNTNYRWLDDEKDARYSHLERGNGTACVAMRMYYSQDHDKTMYALKCNVNHRYICELPVPRRVLHPGDLSADTEIQLGPERKPLVITCSVEVKKTYAAVTLSIDRYPSRSVKPVNVVTHKHYLISGKRVTAQEIKNPKHQNWTFRFSGSNSGSNHELDHFYIEWTLNEPTCVDAGIYACRVNTRISDVLQTEWVGEQDIRVGETRKRGGPVEIYDFYRWTEIDFNHSPVHDD